MAWNKKKYKHSCKHCGKLHSSFLMADICFILDMKLLEPKVKLTTKKEYDSKLPKKK